MSRARAAGLGCALVLGLGGAALGACGDADDEPVSPRTASTPAGGAIELSIRFDDGAGNRELAILTCRGSLQRAGGYLKGKAAVSGLCAKARSVGRLLTTPPDRRRACTEVYGGPQTARVTGTIEAAKVDRLFTRTNGCEIDDFSRAAALLPP